MAPYGSWESPISAAAVSAAGRTVEGLAVAGDGRLLWVETRPEEGGYATRADAIHPLLAWSDCSPDAAFFLLLQTSGPSEGSGGAGRRCRGCDAGGVRGEVPGAGVRRRGVRGARGCGGLLQLQRPAPLQADHWRYTEQAAPLQHTVLFTVDNSW